MKYLVIVEKGASSWGAHVPDLPGCVAAADTKQAVIALIREAVQLHIDEIRRQGQAVPASETEYAFVETDAA